jgi:hypothetical protein
MHCAWGSAVRNHTVGAPLQAGWPGEIEGGQSNE